MQADITTGNTTTTVGKINQYRSWKFYNNSVYYKDVLYFKYYKGILGLNPNNNLSILLGSKLEVPLFYYKDLEHLEAYVDEQIELFINSARNCHFITPAILKLINKLNIDFNDKYLNYCKNLNYANFVQVASKHRQRQSSSKKVLRGLWYTDEYQSRT